MTNAGPVPRSRPPDFSAGLFVMVGALVHTGVIDQLAQAATGAVEGKLWPATMLLLWASAVLSA